MDTGSDPEQVVNVNQYGQSCPILRRLGKYENHRVPGLLFWMSTLLGDCVVSTVGDLHIYNAESTDHYSRSPEDAVKVKVLKRESPNPNEVVQRRRSYAADMGIAVPLVCHVSVTQLVG